MANPPAFLAIDLGAGSGRAILGRLDDKLTVQEIHRFRNDGVRLWNEIQTALRLASVSGPIFSLEVDT